MANELAARDAQPRLSPAAPRRPAATTISVPQRTLTSRQKAAVIVRLLLAEGDTVPLSSLPEETQTALTEQIGVMRSIDRDTLRATIDEFLAELEGVGLSFPGGIDGALNMLNGHISPGAATSLRRQRGMDPGADPWERIAMLPPERLMPVLEEESVEVGAVMLSKLPVAKAADLLGRLAGDRARRVAYAVSLTSNIAPDTVRRIGQSLAAQLDMVPARAFDSDPVERVGAILNVSPALTRDDVLKGLDETDAAFADLVRRAIFTYVNIPARIEPRDVPKIIRVVDQSTLVTAMAGAAGEAAAATEFILANMSQRMAAGLREEIGARGKVKEKDADEAMTAIVTAIRGLEAAGEITMIQPEE